MRTCKCAKPLSVYILGVTWCWNRTYMCSLCSKGHPPVSLSFCALCVSSFYLYFQILFFACLINYLEEDALLLLKLHWIYLLVWRTCSNWYYLMGFLDQYEFSEMLVSLLCTFIQSSCYQINICMRSSPWFLNLYDNYGL